jgi:hypothetical protein
MSMLGWLAGVLLATAAAAYPSVQAAQGGADECAPSWQAMDPDVTAGHMFTAITTKGGRTQTWSWSFPVSARCREAQAVVATLKQGLALESLIVTPCH